MSSSSSLSSEQVIDRIVRLAHVSAALSTADVACLSQLVEGLKQAQREFIVQAVQACDPRVMLIQYSADTTPGLLKEPYPSSPRKYLYDVLWMHQRNFKYSICCSVGLRALGC